MRWTVALLVALAACDEGQSTEPSLPSTASAEGSAEPTAATSAIARCEGCSSLERCEAGACVPSCPQGEVFIPATGPDGFVLGDGKDDNSKSHTVVLTKPFCIDATEVTVAAYAECVEAKQCEAPRAWGLFSTYPKQLDHPVNKVHWKQAKAYCEWREQSLPSEAQWQWAASGGDQRKWAWGDEEPTCAHADFTAGVLRSGASDDGCHGGGPSAVGAHPAGDTIWPSGRIHDLSGNLWEWCLDNFVPFSSTKKTDPVHMDVQDGSHVVRGGGWNRSASGIRIDYRGGAVVDYQVPGLGFRCVRNAD
jgi:formylglycine-generating enzyme required for sulfatase activity